MVFVIHSYHKDKVHLLQFKRIQSSLGRFLKRVPFVNKRLYKRGTFPVKNGIFNKRVGGFDFFFQT